ncbi:MAG: TonB-dependent receptor [bacterium]
MFLKRGFLYSVIFALILLFALNLSAAVTGKITGRVIDKQTKEGLPGVNVIIPELQMGAATDADGYYFILNVPVGTYTVQAQMITYSPVTVEGVDVSADITTTVNFELLPQAIEVEGVTVTARKKLVETNVTSKERTIDEQFLEEMSGTDIMSVVATNAGVSGEGQALHVRGGRVDEVGYMVDGMSVADPTNKSMGATINKNAVEEIKIMTGGFSAEYGEAMSGVVNIVTKEGGKKYNGQVKYEGNSFLPEDMNYGDNRMELSLGGPLFTDKARFFMSGDASSTNDWGPRFHETPDFFYEGDSAFVWDLYEYSTVYDDSLGRYVLNIDTTTRVWADDSVPYFYNNQDTFYFDSASQFNADEYDTASYDSTEMEWVALINRPDVDTVIDNRYGPDYWSDLGPAMPHHKSHEYHGQLKFTFKPTNNIKVNVGGFLSHQSMQNYANALKYNLEKYISRNIDGYQGNATVNWMLNDRNFFTLRGSYFYTSTTVAPEFFEPIEYTDENGDKQYYEPPEQTIPEWYEFWKPYGLVDTTQFKELPSNRDKWRYNSPWGYWSAATVRTQYIYPNYYGYMNYRFSNYWSLKGDWTSQIGRNHEVKAGFQYKDYELFQFDLYLPWDPNPFEDDYNVFPSQISGYVQDKMEFEGMIVNVGMRFDYLSSNTPYYVDPLDVTVPLYRSDTIINGADTTITFEPNTISSDTTIEQGDSTITVRPDEWNVQIADVKYQFSPRLGISHPITETSVLHFNYGHFFQTPQMDYLFSGIGVNIAKRGNSLVGDPNLGAEKTIAYEIGVATQIGNDMAIDFTSYYKDIYGLIGSRKVYSIPQTYYAYQNVEYGNVKGFEVAFQRTGKYFSGNATYTLSFAKGTASDAFEGYEMNYYYTDPVTGSGYSMPKIPYYLSYDQRHIVNLVMTFRMPQGELPVYADNWSLTLNNNIASGRPYTPENLKGIMTGTKNSERMPWTFTTDLKFRKGINIGPITPNFYVQVSNLFNIKNIEGVYVTTGLPDTDGSISSWKVSDWPETSIGDPGYDVRRDLDKDGVCTSEEFYEAAVAAYKDQLNAPTNYSAPRIVTVGLEFSF